MSVAIAAEPESCVIQKLETHAICKGFYPKPKFTKDQKTLHCIIVQTALFAVGEYALHTRNQKLWNAYGCVFVASIPASFIYVHHNSKRHAIHR